MILLIDNFDSFVFNLARYFQQLGQETRVLRNNATDADAVRRMRPDAVVISPGPCTPEKAGCSLELVRQLHEEMPILGVCLGHQVIAEALDGRVVHAAEPVHGRSFTIHHDGRGVFAGVASPFTACRYHSLVVEESTLPGDLEITARTADGTVMGLRHLRLPVVGVQFHPESILTEVGYPVLAGFLRLAGLDVSDPPPTIESEFSAGFRGDSCIIKD